MYDAWLGVDMNMHTPTQVLEAPDCVLAVVLMERTLSARFGDVYMGLGLPALQEGSGLDADGAGDDDGGLGGDGLDAALHSMKSTLLRCLHGFTPTDWQTSEM
jgi:hypothetical protein